MIQIGNRELGGLTRTRGPLSPLLRAIELRISKESVTILPTFMSESDEDLAFASYCVSICNSGAIVAAYDARPSEPHGTGVAFGLTVRTSDMEFLESKYYVGKPVVTRYNARNAYGRLIGLLSVRIPFGQLF